YSMWPNQVRHGVVGQHDAPDVVGPEVDPDAIDEPEDRAVAPRAQTNRMRLVARMRGAHHVLAPVLDPLHGPPEHARDDRDQRVFRIARGLGAEPAAEVWRDDADAVRRQFERRYEALLDEARDRAAARRRGAAASSNAQDGRACTRRSRPAWRWPPQCECA